MNNQEEMGRDEIVTEEGKITFDKKDDKKKIEFISFKEEYWEEKIPINVVSLVLKTYLFVITLSWTIMFFAFLFGSGVLEVVFFAVASIPGTLAIFLFVMLRVFFVVLPKKGMAQSLLQVVLPFLGTILALIMTPGVSWLLWSFQRLNMILMGFIF